MLVFVKHTIYSGRRLILAACGSSSELKFPNGFDDFSIETIAGEMKEVK
jgi:hypothetical protein